nr:SdrD B-like domain-containing protein [Roseimaritima multifibrata]
MWERRPTPRRNRITAPAIRRSMTAESLEPRILMAADPIHVGLVYIETDYLESDSDVGSDSHGDRFILSFTGGAADTELTEIRISTDKDGDGLSVGDPIFDTEVGNRGKKGAHGFKVHKITSDDAVQATATVEDGGQELIIRLEGFHAGDRLEFTIDVDEILRNVADIAIFNEKLDVITSGQEFEDSILEATFKAPHYESANADALFLNEFGDPGADFGLNLPPDEGSGVDSHADRSAAAVGSVTQTPKPISIAGTVWVDNDLDLLRETGEEGLPGVELTLLQRNESSGQFVDTGFRTTTDSAGNYQFGTSLGLMPGTYRVAESQPDGYFSVGAVPGNVDGSSVGTALQDDILTDIVIPKGDLHAVQYNFAEAQPSEVSGYVYRDDSDDGIRDPSEPGIANIRVRLIPESTLANQATLIATTDDNGFYQFEGLSPGQYRIEQIDQPVGLSDGLDTAGTVNGTTVGAATNPGDLISGLVLAGNQTGLEYNFGELPLGSISGMVYVLGPGEDCDGYDPGIDAPLPGVRVVLQDGSGNTIMETTTDNNGEYFFGQLPKGQYTILEFTPAGLIDGHSFAGRINNLKVGEAIDGGRIESIMLPAGGDGIRYDFCEASPAEVSGHVYHDRDQDGNRDSGEEGIADVLIELVDTQGTVIATTQTDGNGYYVFEDILPGTYAIRESQPAGYLDGLDQAGTIAGATVGTAANPGDLIRSIAIKQGQTGVNYDFGELLPASLSGHVHVDTDGDCIADPDEEMLEGVVIQLWNQAGEKIAETLTDSNGRYQFVDLVPGRYTVIELQPEGYFEGGQMAGSAGGDDSQINRIGDVDLGSGEIAVEYNFCELPPAEISGYVHADSNGDCILDPGEPMLENVRVDLLDANGNILATAYTDSNGYYRFTNLMAGQYTVRETQPIGYLQGHQTAGSAGGNDSSQDVISEIPIGYGDRLTDYNFCELEPSSLGGFVYVDSNENCVFESDEKPLGGVEVQLLNEAGEIIERTTTAADGSYRFENLRPGEYSVRELQPVGYFQGGQVVGDGGGIVLGQDHLGKISIGPGERLSQYNFCELEGGSISGMVWSETDLNRDFDSGDQPLADVVVELLNENGDVLRTTTTASDGSYTFDNLRPGNYQVREIQPGGYFHGGQNLGSLGGNVGADDLLVGIQVAGGKDGVDYDFPEVPPAIISGFVFQDGPAITLENPPTPEELRDYVDGIRGEDDTMLAGVWLELRTVQGQPYASSNALPGSYADGVIRVQTDINGFYEFTGLRPGAYSIYQIQPEDFIDGLDTPGTSGGLAVNPADIADDIDLQFIVQTLSASDETNPNDDAILNVDLVAGGRSQENNFSELIIKELPPSVPQPDPDPLPLVIPPYVPNTFPDSDRLAGFGVPEYVKPPAFYDLAYPVTWHLSIINAGSPRGEMQEDGAIIRQTSSQDDPTFATNQHRTGRWNLVTRTGERLSLSDAIILGDEGAIPLAGDFDGDGRDEVAIFVGGQWFVDLNGNGRWDPGDLWISLGTEADRPVVGDWDGDGKDDVGIFGREWLRDPQAIVNDPGLPDPGNRRSTRPKNLPPTAPEATDGMREMRRSTQPIRADLIDHVFRYGQHQDTPLAGDWNGDGIDAIAVFRAGVWQLDEDGDGRWTNADREFEFGPPNGVPVVGDWNGDGIDDFGVVLGDQWILDSDGDRKLTDKDERLQVPVAGIDALPIAGDWDGDGKDEPGSYSTQQEVPTDESTASDEGTRHEDDAA